MIRAQFNERGVILIGLLWILVALSIIAMSFSKESMVEVAAARNSRDLTSSYYVARAGIHTAIYRLLEKRYTPRVQGLGQELAAPDPIDAGVIQGTHGGGAYIVEVQDESAKVSVNTVTEEQLHELLAWIGIVKTDADTIVDSIMDWRDVDNAHRLNGAEDEYYQAMPRPYLPKNNRLDTVEELLLIRGITQEYFFGRREKAEDGSVRKVYGLFRYLTVYSNTPRININYAELPVLKSVPGMQPEVAEQIYARRKANPFKNLAEVTQELPVTINANTLPFLSTEPTGFYTLTASAHMESSRVIRTIRAVINLDPRETMRYKIIYWNENVPGL